MNDTATELAAVEQWEGDLAFLRSIGEVARANGPISVSRETGASIVEVIDRLSTRKETPTEQGEVARFQAGVDAWMDECFGAAIKADVQERSDRFIEEALEFVQAHQSV